MSDSFRRKLAQGATVVGTWITLSDPACTEIISRAGFDFVFIDMQEGPVGLGTLRDLLIAGKGTGTALLVRVAWNDPVRIKRALDLGADGLLAPMVNNAGEARRAVAACKYPPEGSRGVAGGWASGYAPCEPERLGRANGDMAVMIQVEHVEAVQALDDILAVPGIDGVFIGPSDLAASLGHLGRPNHPDVHAAVRRIAEACRASGTPFGTDLGDARLQAALGMRIFLAGMDILFLAAQARASLRATRAALAD